MRFLSIELMLDWVRTVPIATVSSSLAFEIACGFLTGKQWKSGGQASDSLRDLSPAEYLVAKARQFKFYPVKRMIRGLGAETISTYSQTLNG